MWLKNYTSYSQFVYEFELRPGVVVYWFEVGGGFSGEVCVDAVGGEFFGWSAVKWIYCHFIFCIICQLNHNLYNMTFTIEG